MRILFLLLASASLTTAACGQEEQRPAESACFELFGNTGVYSLNADVAFPNGLGFRLGAIDASRTTYNRTTGYDARRVGFSFLMMLQAHGSGRHRMEGGFGIIVGRWYRPTSGQLERSPALTATFGYRYQPPAKGIVFRFGFTPTLVGNRLRPMVGISIGYTLGDLFRKVKGDHARSAVDGDRGRAMDNGRWTMENEAPDVKRPTIQDPPSVRAAY